MFVPRMKYITINDVAAKTHYSLPTLYRYVSKRRIPFIKLGHRLLFQESEIENWIDSHKVPMRNSLLKKLN